MGLYVIFKRNRKVLEKFVLGMIFFSPPGDGGVAADEDDHTVPDRHAAGSGRQCVVRGVPDRPGHHPIREEPADFLRHTRRIG